MDWQRHYTGTDTAEVNWWKLNLYLQREGKRLCFARLSGWRRMIGVFIGSGNYVKGIGGFEVFTNRWHIGWVKPTWGKQTVWWSGSMKDPYHSVTLRIGRFGIGRETPMWLKRRKEKIETKKWEEQYDLMLENTPVDDAEFNSFTAIRRSERWKGIE